MSLFIQVENQTILWETIHKIPVLHIVFPEGSQQEKIEWFKGHIEKKYAQLPPTISRNDLYKINREVLSGMSDHLQLLSNSNTVNKIQPNNPQTVNIQMQDTTRGTFSRLQNPSKKTDYENTELQYKSLFDVPKPKVIDFSEKIDDEVITNMEELIENHKKMREQELQQFLPLVSPPPVTPPPVTPPPVTPTGSTMPISNKISIMEPIQKEELRPIVVEEKRVSFQLPTDNINENSKMATNLPTLLELQQRYENIDNKMNEILHLLKNVFTKLPYLESSVDSAVNSSADLSKEYNDIEKIKRMMNE